MRLAVGLLLAVLTLLQLVIIPLTSGSCIYYEFEAQPPLYLDCDPYSRDSDRIVWGLRMDCRVEKRSNRAGSFDVHWFRRDPVTQAVTDLGRLKTLDSNDEEVEIRYGEHIQNDDFTDSMLGDYWCQVISTTTQPHTYLGMSNVLTILHPDQYGRRLSDCDGVISNNTNTCVNIPSRGKVTSLQPSTSSEHNHHITMTTLGSSATNHHQVPTLSTSSVHVSMHSLDHVTHSTVQPTLISTSTVPTTLPPILPPSILPVSMTTMQTVLLPMLPVSAATTSSSLTNTMYIVIQSTTDALLEPMAVSGKCSPSNTLLLHITHSVIHVILLLIIIILIAIMCLRKRLTKVVQKLPIYVEVLEATPDTMKTQSSADNNSSKLELQSRNDCDEASAEGTAAVYMPLNANTMLPKREYAVVKYN